MSRDMARRIRVAKGEEPADLVLRGGRVFNVFTRQLEDGDVAIADGVIAGVGGHYEGAQVVELAGAILCPGFIDAHIHLESSMVLPTEFARAVVPHGTTTVVADPHEIANVLGVDGIRYMQQTTEKLPLTVRLMLPSCVPATPLDESGATLTADDLRPLYGENRVLGLAELMNYVGLIAGDPDVLEKVTDATAYGAPVDGHAPGLSGHELNAYVGAGIVADHECADLAQAQEKLSRGQYIFIREGTAAHNLEALCPLLHAPTDARCAFSTDDKHPNDLLHGGHIDALLRQAVALGADPAAALCAATWNPAACFGLTGYGAVAPGYIADLAVVDNLTDFTVSAVFKDGREVFADGVLAPFAVSQPDEALARRAADSFHLAAPLTAADFEAGRRGMLRLVPGQLLTTSAGFADHADVVADRLKLAVIERHHATGHIGIGYVEGYGLKRGAIATSIAHDSHNLIVIGADNADMALAANRVADNHGGIVVVVNGAVTAEVPLPIAGLLSDRPLAEVDAALSAAKQAAFAAGVSHDIDPFMTLSFLSLPVIPSRRVTTQGVFDVDSWSYVD